MVQQLISDGWCVSEASVAEFLDQHGHEPVTGKPLEKLLLNARLSDIKDYGDAIILESHLDRKSNVLHGPLVLQISRVRNVAVPKLNEMRNSGKDRLLKLSLTDGTQTINALELGTHIHNLSTDTAPGCKILLKSASIVLEKGFLLLNNSNCSVLGGQVLNLWDKWMVDRDAYRKLQQRHQRTNKQGPAGKGPPKWIPFDKATPKDRIAQPHDKNFRAMVSATGVDKTDNAEPDLVTKQFEAERQLELQRLAADRVNNKFANAQAAATKVPLQPHVPSVVQATAEAVAFDTVTQTADKELAPKKPISEKQQQKRAQNVAKYLEADERSSRHEESKPASGPATLFSFLEDKIQPTKQKRTTTAFGGQLRGQITLDDFEPEPETRGGPGSQSQYGARAHNQDPRFDKQQHDRDNFCGARGGRGRFSDQRGGRGGDSGGRGRGRGRANYEASRAQGHDMNRMNSQFKQMNVNQTDHRTNRIGAASSGYQAQAAYNSGTNMTNYRNPGAGRSSQSARYNSTQSFNEPAHHEHYLNRAPAIKSEDAFPTLSSSNTANQNAAPRTHAQRNERSSANMGRPAPAPRNPAPARQAPTPKMQGGWQVGDLCAAPWNDGNASAWL